MIVPLTAGWAASADALPSLPPPPITLPTVTLPTVTIPTVTVPPVTTPVVTTPAVTTPAVTTPTTPLPPQAPPPPRVPGGTPPAPPSGASVRQAGAAGGAATTGAGHRTNGTTRGGRAETSREQASRLRLARDGSRRATLVFTLRKSAAVELDVQQLAPDCRRIGRFRVRGRRGVNRVRLRTRLGRHTLTPGTYSVVVRSRGRTVGHARFLVVDRKRKDELRPGRGTNMCGQTQSVGGSSTSEPPAGILGAAAADHPAAQQKHHRRALGARFVKGGLGLAGTADDIPYWAYILVALAVTLLGTALILPRRKAGLSAAILIAFLGAAIILGLTITYALA